MKTIGKIFIGLVIGINQYTYANDELQQQQKFECSHLKRFHHESLNNVHEILKRTGGYYQFFKVRVQDIHSKNMKAFNSVPGNCFSPEEPNSSELPSFPSQSGCAAEKAYFTQTLRPAIDRAMANFKLGLTYIYYKTEAEFIWKTSPNSNDLKGFFAEVIAKADEIANYRCHSIGPLQPSEQINVPVKKKRQE